MQKISSMILFDFVPRFSRDVHAATDIDDMKSSSLTLMKDLAQLLFGGEKLVLNDPSDQPQDSDDLANEPGFMQTVIEEAQRYYDAA